jgi:hypothetical protein
MCSTCCALGVVAEYREHQFVAASGWVVYSLGNLVEKRR